MYARIPYFHNLSTNTTQFQTLTTFSTSVCLAFVISNKISVNKAAVKCTTKMFDVGANYPNYGGFIYLFD